MKHDSNNKHSHPPLQQTAKRIIAWIAIVLLLGMYIATFVSALLSRPGTGDLFRFCLGMTIAVPIFAWIAIWAVGVLTHRHTIASMDILNSNPEARKEMEDAVQNAAKGKDTAPEDDKQTS